MWNFKGIEKLNSHFSDLQTPGGRIRLALRALFIFLLTTVFFLWTDHIIQDWQPDGQILALTSGFLLAGRFFWQKSAYQEKYEELAYRNAFVHFMLPGIMIIFATIAHSAYAPGIVIPNVWWKVYLSALGWLFVTVGGVLWVRSILTFGVDNLTMLYVYYPDESRLVESQIYSVLRHPIYSGALRVMIGLCLLNGNWPALFFALFVPVGFTGWIRLVEEKELLDRFPGYAEYRRKIPAFWTWQAGKFWRFLLSGR